MKRENYHLGDKIVRAEVRISVEGMCDIPGYFSGYLFFSVKS